MHPSLNPILGAFRGAGFDVLIHVPLPETAPLRRAMDAYEGVVGHRLETPKIEDTERGVVRFFGFGDKAKRRALEGWLLTKYGWEGLPRPLRTSVAFQNRVVSDFAEDTAAVFQALESLGWAYRREDHRIGVGLYKPGTPATDFKATISGERVKAAVFWRACWEGGRVLPNWVTVGGTPGCPRSVPSRFSSLELSAELLLEEDRHRLSGHQALREGLAELLSPLVSEEGPLSLAVPQESATEADWPGDALEFKLQ